ncbi:MAG: transcription antitermination factor NusB [Candidatus Taylorbacteria bacterium]|nr:transcription antitermination factor NusB [Candidatus Taylorbacteria bacterium]
MANRHLARSTVLQTLFEWDFNGQKPTDDLELILERDVLEFAPGIGDTAFMRELLRSILEKRGDIDMIIEKAAPDWPLNKISIVDRNVLRIGLYELLFADKNEVPEKVAINEAIELAKTYGGENSGKFVNGVLGSVYKELGEPGKDVVSKKSKRKNDVPFEKMLIQKLGGAVVYARDGSDVYLALVHDIFGHWTLSKGKIEVDENVEQGTIREIKEELGVDIVIKEQLGKNEYVASDPEKGKIRKQVNYFLGETKFETLKLGTSGGLDDARWFKMADIVSLNIYNDILPIVTKAVNILLQDKK